MCDKCYKCVNRMEIIHSFYIKDNEGNEKVFQGHASCMNEIGRTIQIMYGDVKNV